MNQPEMPEINLGSKHRLFLREFGLQLIRPQMEWRSMQPGLHIQIQQAQTTTSAVNVD